MEEDRRSRIIAVSGSLLLHVVFALLLLRLLATGGDPSHGGRTDNSLTVVTLAPPSPLASNDKKRFTPRTDAPRVHREKATERSVDLPVPSKFDPSSQVPQVAARSDAPTAASTTGTGILAATGEDIRIYQHALLVHIEHYRRYPLDERRQRIEGVVTIHFAMDRYGNVLDVWIDRSSGVAALDTEAVATVRRAQPLPMIPTRLPDRLSIVLPVSFSIQ